MARKGLGRGLGALLAIEEEDTQESQHSQQENPSKTPEISLGNESITQIDIRKIEPNRSQPRQYFDDASLEELADSIRTYGIIQPLILKKSGGFYSIIAGERRFRAARLANLESVPAIIKDYTELETLQIALIENIQRQDLTPIEEAVCYKRLMEDFFFSQEDIAAKIGKNRTAVSNSIKLLDLDPRVQDLVSLGEITVSHARVLYTVKDGDNQYELANLAAVENLSVRATENLVNDFQSKFIKDQQDQENQDGQRELLESELLESGLLESGLLESELMESEYEDIEDITEDDISDQGLMSMNNMQAAYRQAEEDLKSIFGAKVNILQGKKKGKIEIEYYSPEELDRLLGLFKVISKS